MRRLSEAIFDLLKSILVRPAKPKASKIHWVKAGKPIDSMTNFERREFANHLAEEMLGAIKDQGE
jgi:hypothetical protein